jgi:hypothetical protein
MRMEKSQKEFQESQKDSKMSQKESFKEYHKRVLRVSRVS